MSEKPRPELIVIGKLGSSYGIRGWIKVFSYTDPMTNIADYPVWYVEKKAGWESVVVEACQPHVKLMIAKLKGLNTPEEARLWTGKKIAIEKSQLPSLKKDEYYWRDLEGLNVINQQGIALGKVIYLLETGANDVMVVKGKREFAIPFLSDDVIKKVDLEQGVIYVDWQEEE